MMGSPGQQDHRGVWPRRWIRLKGVSPIVQESNQLHDRGIDEMDDYPCGIRGLLLHALMKTHSIDSEELNSVRARG